MDDKPKILLVEDNPKDAYLMRGMRTSLNCYK